MEKYDPSESRNYYILGDSHSEMVQLIATGRDFTRAMGGLLPEQPDQVLAGLHAVLDVACGPGEWTLAMAQANPDIQVTGLDISQGMIEYATSLARASDLDNVHFQFGNALDGLPFPDNSFDLVNARQIEGVIPAADWPTLLKEMVRVARPGGIVRIVGNEWGVSNSAAVEKAYRLNMRGWLVVGLAHGPDENNCAITAMQGRYLRDAGCVNIQERPSMMDISAGAEFEQAGHNIWVVSMDLIEPFFLSTGVISSKEELQTLKQQLIAEISSKDFAGIIYTLTSWGQKPA